MTELKPCPFCGSKAKKHKYDVLGEIIRLAYCPNENCHFHHRTASVTAWNTRPIEDKLQARITDLVSANLAMSAGIPRLQARIAELEAERTQLFEDKSRLMSCYFEFETIAPDGELKISVLDLYNELVEMRTRAEKAEAMVERLIKAGSALVETFQGYPDFEEYPEVGKWDTLVDEWKEREK